MAKRGRISDLAREFGIRRLHPSVECSVIGERESLWVVRWDTSKSTSTIHKNYLVVTDAADEDAAR